ncbi:F0F1 ATP synthase subunit alpha, partial [Candidatus Dojkabacteria bacterium]|nr:F0F1 ATP synthase subunit alpha [Candidatus Dojkabacteria bacterium]
MEIKNTGKVIEAKDGIAVADGLSGVGSNEIVKINTSTGEQIDGLALNLEENTVGIVVIGDFLKVGEGDTVEATGEVSSVQV